MKYNLLSKTKPRGGIPYIIPLEYCKYHFIGLTMSQPIMTSLFLVLIKVKNIKPNGNLKNEVQ